MWNEKIREHYETQWEERGEPRRFDKGPVSDLASGFEVLRFKPGGGRSMWAYATAGMSCPDDEKPIEIHTFSPHESEDVTEILYAVAHFHRTGSRLDLGHTVNFGQPWWPKSNCDYGLVSLPYLDGPELESLNIDSKTVKFYWMIPITKAERDYKAVNGLESLEELFEKEGLDYVNPLRSSLI